MARSNINKGAFSKVANNIKRLKENRKGDKRSTFEIRFSAPYAAKVHEDLEMAHPNGGQAKFLEQPLREHGKKISQMIKLLMKQGRTLRQAILITANWFLVNYVNPLVPVLTGELVNSARIRLVKS